MLNDSFNGGDVGGAATAFAFTLQAITRNVRPAWYPIIYGSIGRADDEVDPAPAAARRR